MKPLLPNHFSLPFLLGLSPWPVISQKTITVPPTLLQPYLSKINAHLQSCLQPQRGQYYLVPPVSAPNVIRFSLLLPHECFSIIFFMLICPYIRVYINVDFPFENRENISVRSGECFNQVSDFR